MPSPKEPQSSNNIRRLEGTGRYCHDCFYELKGIDSAGKCPECGRPFDFRDLNSYSLDDRPPGLAQRALSRRMIAFISAITLEGLAIGIELDFSCLVIPLFPLWQFIMVWLLIYAAGLDHRLERSLAFIVTGAILGSLILVPFGEPLVLPWGPLGGSFAGLLLYEMKIARWLD